MKQVVTALAIAIWLFIAGRIVLYISLCRWQDALLDALVLAAYTGVYWYLLRPTLFAWLNSERRTDVGADLRDSE